MREFVQRAKRDGWIDGWKGQDWRALHRKSGYSFLLSRLGL